MSDAARSYGTRLRRRPSGDEAVRRELAALYDLLTTTLGKEKLVMRAGKLGALRYLRSEAIGDRFLALQRIVFEDPTFERAPARNRRRAVLDALEDAIADLVAAQALAKTIERKVDERMATRSEAYARELKLEVLRESVGPETPANQRRLDELSRLDSRGVSSTALVALRPQRLEEIVGQAEAVAALVAKLASPYPQHVILYGPPGVGKTSAARLALAHALARGGSAFAPDAPFVEVAGTTLRWDPRDTTNPLLGSVHDPIYQGSRSELSESGIPEPKLGLVTQAHGGVLFIDEIGEMAPGLQTKLLKVLEDKRVEFSSSYYDEQDPNVPAYVKKLFAQGAPADFILIGATTREPEAIDPAIRSRCAAIYFEALEPTHVAQIVREAATRLNAPLARTVPALIADYTNEGRKAVQLLADACGHAWYTHNGGNVRLPVVRNSDVRAVASAARLARMGAGNTRAGNARKRATVGRVCGLGVAQHVGSLIEIEAAAFPVREPGRGSIRFNETAGSMARDAVFTACAALRAVCGLDPTGYDLHVNVIGGGNIDGPSAGLAFFLALASAISGLPFPGDVAVTGEISLSGEVRAVGGIVEKLYAARAAGMRAVVLPAENSEDISAVPGGLAVIPVSKGSAALAACGLRAALPSTVFPSRRSRSVSR
jgi:ATP-dependent Lon protease